MARTQGSSSDITGPRIRRVAERLFAQAGFAAVSMRQIAAEVGVSLRKLHYAFSQTDKTVMGHIRSRRLASARQDLANGVLLDRLSITEIAYRWAFADPAQFSRAFRQAYGESPGSFRKSACAGRF